MSMAYSLALIVLISVHVHAHMFFLLGHSVYYITVLL